MLRRSWPRNSYMVSYSGGNTLRNFTLGADQPRLRLHAAQLELGSERHAAAPDAGYGHGAAGRPAARGAHLRSGERAADLRERRQHNVPDPQKGGTISNWDTTFALVLGNEVSGDDSWQGEIKFVAIHQRALTAAQMLQNYNAGVGQRYYLLFNVSNVPGVNVSQAYIMFTVSQYDSYSYLFYQPTFISLDPTAKPTSIPLSGHAHRHQRHDPAGGPGVHPAEHHHHGGELHRSRRGAVAGGHGHRARERSADRPVLPAVRPARHREGRDRRGDAAAGDACPGARPMADVGVRSSRK